MQELVYKKRSKELDKLHRDMAYQVWLKKKEEEKELDKLQKKQRSKSPNKLSKLGSSRRNLLSKIEKTDM